MKEVITHFELHDPPEISHYRSFMGLESPEDCAKALVAKRRRKLIERSGVFNTIAGHIAVYEDIPTMSYIMEARFDSRAWTGLP